MSTELMERNRAELQPRKDALAPDMAAMIERLATNPDVDVAKLEALIGLQERVMNRAAEAEFNEAFVALQGSLQTVPELSKTDKGTYAAREDIVDVARPYLSQHGFSLNFRTEWPDKATVRVVGILTHSAGHSRTSEFMASADTSGSKNAIQALGSTVEYGRRYSTVDLLNIVTRKADDDGRRSGTPAPPDGFDLWWDDMTSTADNGAAELKAAWEKAPKERKEYTLNHKRDEWARLKTKAAKVAK